MAIKSRISEVVFFFFSYFSVLSGSAINHLPNDIRIIQAEWTLYFEQRT